MPVPFHSGTEFLQYLEKLNFFHMDLSLQRVERALKALQLLRPPFTVVQVVGTNGKGSTASFLASLLSSYGCSCGLFTSPHFIYPSERIRINGKRVPEDIWLDVAAKAWLASPDMTYFELLTVIALALFRESGVRVAILEAGLGARFDATTATAADLVCFTPMALDHTAILGPMLEDIAKDKTCAIRSSAPICTAPQFPVAQSILEKRAASLHASVSHATPTPPQLTLGLAGQHQRINAGTALTALQILLPWLNEKPDYSKTAKGLIEAFIPGRLQFLPACNADENHPARPACLLDGAHNPHGMAALTTFLTETQKKPCAVIFSCLHDKNWHPALEMLAKNLPGVPFLIPAMHNSRAEDPQAILTAVPSSSHPGTRTYSHFSEALSAACNIAQQRTVLLTGSLYLLSDFFTLFPEALEQLPKI